MAVKTFFQLLGQATIVVVNLYGAYLGVKVIVAILSK
jgi:hypothetical protein